MMNRRREMLLKKSGGGGKLPDEFQEVEYLRSRYRIRQYINTGISITKQDIVNITFMYEEAVLVNDYIFGARTSATENNVCLYNNTTGTATLDYGNYMDNRIIMPNFAKNRIYDCCIDNLKMVLNDVVYPMHPTDDFATPNIFLFQAFTSLETENTIKRIYAFTVKDKCKLIPCRRKADSKPGMYDVINQVFLTNQGNDDFLLGGDV